MDQRRARQDKEQGIKDKCRQIEESNTMGRTRDLYREIKEMTGSYSSRCGAMKLSTGKVVTEGKEVKEIWQQYTEELYRRDPNATDSFNENIYEDEPEVMGIEVKEALRHISNRKSAGCDGIPIELLKAGGQEAVKVMTGLCNCIWKRKEWPTDWKKSVYVPIYKKGDKKECGNYRTIALISHASKVLLWVIQRRLEVFLIPELPIEQAGFRRGRGTRDHIANLRWMMEKAREYQRDLYMCFIDYKKAFDCVDHERLWVILRGMGVPVHLIVLLKRLYTNQEATVRTEFGETDNIDIGKGVRQGCILSPLLFNIYAENIMREALEEWENGISIGGSMVTNLRYADDTTLLAGTKEELIELVERVRRASEKAGLYLNVGKTKVMTTGDIGEVTVDGKDIEVVTKFVFLGALITKDGLCEKEVRRRIAMGKATMGGLTSIWKDRGVTMETKVKLVKVLVFPIVLYGAETWTLRKHERRKIDAFELWCWRRVLRVSWMERKTNIWIIENIKPEWTLESRVPKAALSYFGHVVRAGGMEDDVMLRRMNGARRRGRPRQRWLDTFMGYSSGATISNMRRYARDRAGWRGAATDVARSRMRLDGTR